MTSSKGWGLIAAAAFMAATFAHAAAPGNVKVTPLGSHDGELCPQDRAMIFEDPNGTRVLYDPGRTVAHPRPSTSRATAEASC